MTGAIAEGGLPEITSTGIPSEVFDFLSPVLRYVDELLRTIPPLVSRSFGSTSLTVPTSVFVPPSLPPVIGALPLAGWPAACVLLCRGRSGEVMSCSV
eukprot:COSAG02_NODE_1548_length_11970_cov_43.634235_1_plen_98_part_00